MGFFEVIKLIMRVWDTINSILAAYKAKEGADWDAKIEQDLKAYNAWALAKTPQEKSDAQKAVAGTWLRK